MILHLLTLCYGTGFHDHFSILEFHLYGDYYPGGWFYFHTGNALTFQEILPVGTFTYHLDHGLEVATQGLTDSQ